MLFDGRNIWEPAEVRALGFTYYGHRPALNQHRGGIGVGLDARSPGLANWPLEGQAQALHYALR